MKNKDVIILCGEYPDDHITPDIGNNPNYIFLNDPSYAAVRLFDLDGNTVIVNSFTECEHYVNGTWDYYPGKDEILHLTNINILLFTIFISALLVRVFRKKRVD